MGILLYLECFERHRQKERTNRCAFPIRQIEGGEGVCISDAAHTDLHISQPQTRHEKTPFADAVASCALLDTKGVVNYVWQALAQNSPKFFSFLKIPARIRQLFSAKRQNCGEFHTQFFSPSSLPPLSQRESRAYNKSSFPSSSSRATDPHTQRESEPRR